MRQLKQIGKQMAKAPDGQISLTDPDARSMATSGRGTGMVGYNVQTAVDAKHHLIVAHEVTNVGHDRDQLSSMAQKAREATGRDKLTVLADRGYFKGEEILDCEQSGIATLVPKPQTSNNKAAGLFDKAEFRYIPSKDQYRCPARKRAIWRFTTVEDGMTIHKYWSSDCPKWPFKSCFSHGLGRLKPLSPSVLPQHYRASPRTFVSSLARRPIRERYWMARCSAFRAPAVFISRCDNESNRSGCNPSDAH
jgi:hypothetical protein